MAPLLGLAAEAEAASEPAKLPAEQALLPITAASIVARAVNSYSVGRVPLRKFEWSADDTDSLNLRWAGDRRVHELQSCTYAYYGLQNDNRCIQHGTNNVSAMPIRHIFISLPARSRGATAYDD